LQGDTRGALNITTQRRTPKAGYSRMRIKGTVQQLSLETVTVIEVLNRNPCSCQRFNRNSYTCQFANIESEELAAIDPAIRLKAQEGYSTSRCNGKIERAHTRDSA